MWLTIVCLPKGVLAVKREIQQWAVIIKAMIANVASTAQFYPEIKTNKSLYGKCTPTGLVPNMSTHISAI